MKKPFNLQTSTEKEREKLAEMIAESMKDVVYANANLRATQIVQSIFRLSDIKDLDKFDITYNIQFDGGAIKSFIGNIRRKKEKNK